MLQGDTLAPFLFIIVVDYVLRMSVDKNYTKGYELKPRQSSRHPAVHVTDADFAHEIISHSLANCQSLIRSLEEVSNCIGLYLNETKTEYMNKCFYIQIIVSNHFKKHFKNWLKIKNT